MPSDLLQCISLIFSGIFTESEQITGSFKLRGAFNKLLSLKESNDEVFLTQGAITASTGNHGAAAVSACYHPVMATSIFCFFNHPTSLGISMLRVMLLYMYVLGVGEPIAYPLFSVTVWYMIGHRCAGCFICLMVRETNPVAFITGLNEVIIGAELKLSTQLS